MEVLCACRLLCHCCSLALGFGVNTVLHSMSDGGTHLFSAHEEMLGHYFLPDFSPSYFLC